VLSRVNHCDLRDLQWAAVVGPAERCGASVVVLDERDDALGELVDGAELAAAQQPAFQDREEQLDLVEPRRVGRREVQTHVRVPLEEVRDQLGAVGLEVVDDAMQVQTGWCLGDEVAEELDEVLRAGRMVTRPATSPSCTLRAANSTAVP
jgi:hypothetical protein